MSKMHNPKAWKLVRNLELYEEELEFSDLAFIEETEVCYCPDLDEWVEVREIKKMVKEEKVKHVDRR